MKKRDTITKKKESNDLLAIPGKTQKVWITMASTSGKTAEGVALRLIVNLGDCEQGSKNTHKKHSRQSSCVVTMDKTIVTTAGAQPDQTKRMQSRPGTPFWIFAWKLQSMNVFYIQSTVRSCSQSMEDIVRKSMDICWWSLVQIYRCHQPRTLGCHGSALWKLMTDLLRR